MFGKSLLHKLDALGLGAEVVRGLLELDGLVQEAEHRLAACGGKHDQAEADQRRRDAHGRAVDAGGPGARLGHRAQRRRKSRDKPGKRKAHDAGGLIVRGKFARSHRGQCEEQKRLCERYQYRHRLAARAPSPICAEILKQRERVHVQKRAKRSVIECSVR